MKQLEAYQLQELVRKEMSYCLHAIFCLRAIAGQIGKKPWVVKANIISTKNLSIFDLRNTLNEKKVTFTSLKNYETWKEGRE